MTRLASIIIPSRNQLVLLSACISSLTNRTLYKPCEIIVVDNQSNDPRTLKYIRSLESEGAAQILNYNQHFNFPAMNNLAAQQAKGDILVFMNNDIEVITPGWLEELVSLASIPENGATGTMLYYPDNTIQHAGIDVGRACSVSHKFKGQPRGYNDPDGYLNQRQYVTAVTAACMAIRRDLFLEIGGFDEVNLPINFNDVDLCLRLREKGYKNVWTPFAEFYHHESATRKPERRLFKSRQFKNEIKYMMSRWPQCRR